MAGRTTAVYTCLALENVAPQVEVEIFDCAIDCSVSVIFLIVFNISLPLISLRKGPTFPPSRERKSYVRDPPAEVFVNKLHFRKKRYSCGGGGNAGLG